MAGSEVAARYEDQGAEDAAPLAKIAENLHRREISALERNELLDRWVKLTEKKSAEPVEAAMEVAEVRPLREPGKGAGSKGGIRQAARDLGVPRSTLQQAVKIAALSPEAKDAARKAGLADNQAAAFYRSQKQMNFVGYWSFASELGGTPSKRNSNP